MAVSPDPVDSLRQAPGAVGVPNRPIRRLRIYFIKPSKYDNDGYVIRYLRGVLPSNTLSCLYSLTEDLANRQAFGGNLKLDPIIIDEAVQKVRVDRIIRRARRQSRTRTVIALTGVQTNQFVRARDLALQFREAGLPVMIGGFHVSGLLSMVGAVPADIQELLDRGVTIVKGEVEEAWEAILGDAVRGQLQPIYDLIDSKPDLYLKPIPRVNRTYMRRFVYSGFGTIDAGRGCPFDCSFCTIINVQGRKMRHRSADLIEARIREDYHKLGVRFYFFTDDNFARNKNWEAIMDRLIKLRRDEHMDVQFMMQVDVLSYKIPGFVEKAKAAGCSNVFIGMESINPKNLADAGKTQNDVDDFKNLIAAWHNAGIITHSGYILGFPHDTPESVREDIKRLKEEVKLDLISFFVLTPLPGSMDHLRMSREGVAMDPDYNNYDSFRETIRHPNFEPGELNRAYREAWDSFYSTENMKAVLARSNEGTYWDIFKNYLWFRHSIIDGQHPMIAGFVRIKDRTSRRPGIPIEGRLAHLRRRIPEMSRKLIATWRMLMEMEEVWLQTHTRSRERLEYVKELQLRIVNVLVGIKGLDRREMTQRLIDMLHQFRGRDTLEFRQHLDQLTAWLREFDPKGLLQQVAEQIRAVQQQIDSREGAWGRAAAGISGLQRQGGRLRRSLARLNFLALRRPTSRQPLQQYWDQTIANIRKGRLFRINPVRFAVNMLRDLRYLAAFAFGVAIAKIRYNEVGDPLGGL